MIPKEGSRKWDKALEWWSQIQIMTVSASSERPITVHWWVLENDGMN